MMEMINSTLIPFYLLWILCLFVARKTLTRKQTHERKWLATKTHKTHKIMNRT